MKALIIGGAGFIGSNLVRRLLLSSETEHVTVLDDFSSGRLAFLPLDEPRLTIHEGSVLEAPLDLFASATHVFHLAANPDISAAALNPTLDFYKGTVLTQHVVNECFRCETQPRLIYTSGSGVYGEAPGVNLTENHGPLLPISPYGASKLAGEAIISAYCHMLGLTALVFRFANVVGPNQTHGVGYDFMRRLKDDPTKLRILGDGTQRKPYIHVDDIISAVLLADSCHQKGYDVFNVSTNDTLSVREIAHLAMGTRGLLDTELQFTGGDRGWPGDVPQVMMDASKIGALGWSPTLNSRGAMRCALDSML